MKPKSITAIIIIVIIALCSYFVFLKKQKLTYTFNSPTSKVILPEILHEISGLTLVSDSTIACVQDEKGIIFIYNFIANKIISKYYFAPDGDYEGITKVNNSFFILRSDGVLIEVENYHDENSKVNEYFTSIPAKDNEGICYDKKNNQLLIASKSKILKGSDFKTKRGVYTFNLSTKKVNKQPLFVFDTDDFNQQKKEVKFKMSGIAIHPITQEIYILSASDYLLFVFNENGEFQSSISLNSKIYNKAEGITFLNNGDLLISNEGQKIKPTLLLLKAKRN